MAAQDIPTTARAAVITALGSDYTLSTSHPVPQPSSLKPGECLVKMEYAGVCHTDLHVRKGDWPIKAPEGIVGGHEGIGRVVAIGEGTYTGVDEPSGVKVGDRVGLKWLAKVCGRHSCDACRVGADQGCPVASEHVHGFTQDGTFSEYALSYVDYVTPIPENLDPAEATPLLCAGLTIYTAIKAAGCKTGDWIAIPGAGGGLGHLGVQFAVALGLRVVAIDTGAEKKQLVESLGAERWVDFAESKNLIEDVQKAADGLGPHAAVIAPGVVTPFNQALMYLRSGGKLVCVGMPGNDAAITAPIVLLITKRLHIIGSYVGTREGMREALQLAAQGKVKCRYTQRRWDELNDILNELEEGKVAGRIVVKF